MKRKSSRRGARRRSITMLDRAIGGLSLVVVHELGALSGHWAEVRERAAVARRARSLGELIRDQVDLLPETRQRLVNDQTGRRELLQSWVRDLRDSWRPAA